VVIANGVITLVADKRQAFAESWRVLRASGEANARRFDVYGYSFLCRKAR
jgi:hypothetical protein